MADTTTAGNAVQQGGEQTRKRLLSQMRSRARKRKDTKPVRPHRLSMPLPESEAVGVQPSAPATIEQLRSMPADEAQETERQDQDQSQSSFDATDNVGDQLQQNRSEARNFQAADRSNGTRSTSSNTSSTNASPTVNPEAKDSANTQSLGSGQDTKATLPDAKSAAASRQGLRERLGNEMQNQEAASQPSTRIGKAAEERAMKRGLSQARARGAAAGAEALARGEGAIGAAESSASAVLAAKKFQQFKNVLMVAKIGTGITVVGIVITILIWGLQLVMGHILQREKWKMSKIELWLAAGIWASIFCVLGFVIFALVYVIWALGHPLEALFEAVKAFFANIF